MLDKALIAGMSANTDQKAMEFMFGQPPKKDQVEQNEHLRYVKETNRKIGSIMQRENQRPTDYYTKVHKAPDPNEIGKSSNKNFNSNLNLRWK